MKLAIVGYGSMGKLIHQLASDQGFTEFQIVDPKSDKANHQSIDSLNTENTDIAIDFSLPTCALDNIKFYSDNKIPAVIGTTGWYSHLSEVESMLKSSGSKLLWSSNFSIGVNAYFKIAEAAAEVFNAFEEYDVWGTELHHANKADSPSGTAKTLCELVTSALDRKSKIVYDKLDRKPEADELHFSSVRGGEVNFEHTLAFDSAVDTVLIKHSARNRNGYAKGALQAAKWLLSEDAGLYGFDDFMKGVLK